MRKDKKPNFEYKKIGSMHLVFDAQTRTGAVWVIDGGEDLAKKIATILNQEAQEMKRKLEQVKTKSNDTH